jgi:hypothetical protein
MITIKELILLINLINYRALIINSKIWFINYIKEINLFKSLLIGNLQHMNNIRV